jgi:catechol 2,3-dioxygenase-like lactoylglutathione lyase family enzyme
MSLRLVAVAFDSHDPNWVTAFWAGMLNREIIPEANGALLPGDDTQVGIRFVSASTKESGVNRLHLHLTSSTLEDQQHTIKMALGLGGRKVDGYGQLPDEGHVVLADPDGNMFCVIEPGNNYLAGCGFLGEVACIGSRQVGLFWRDALGWPLVWDQDEETAVQSPMDGTKLAWGGQPVAPKKGRNRQRFELATSDLDAEMERLVALGASELGDRDVGIELADSDGNEFSVSRG